MLPENGVAVGDRGFCSHKVLDRFIENDALFIIRIKLNWKWDENYHITTERGRVRVVCFGNVQQKVDYYLATNIPEDIVISNKFATFAFTCKPCLGRGYSDDQCLKVLHFPVKRLYNE